MILRWSRRIATTDNMSNVRPSKKSEVLLMRKLGLIAPSALATTEAQQAYGTLFERPLPADHLTAIRELLPAAEALSDKDLTVVLLQAMEHVPVA